MAFQSAEAVEPPSTSVPWVYLSSIVFLLSAAVFYLYLARVLSYTDLGAVVILSAIGALMAVVFSLGIGPGLEHYLSFYLGKSDAGVLRTLIRSGFIFAFVLSGAAAVATLALSTAFSDLFFHSRAYASAIALLSIFAGLQSGNSALQSVLLGLQRFAAYSVVFILTSVSIYGFALGFLWLHTGIDSIIEGWALGAAVGFVLAASAILRRLPARGTDNISGARVKSNLHRGILAYSLPLFVWAVLATGTTYVDRLVLASVADLASVGVYNYALLIATGSLVVVWPFATILIPKASKFFGQSNEREIRMLARTAITLIVLVYVPFGLGIAALSPFLLRYLAGPGFVSGSVAMIALAVISAIFVPYSVLSSIAAGTRRTISFAKAAGLALVCNVTLSVVLVPRLGMLGAALGNSSMVWVPFLVFYRELRTTGFVDFDLSSLVRIWLAAGTMCVVLGVPLWLLNYDVMAVPGFVVLGVACLALMLRMLKAIPAETATTLLRVLPRRLAALRPAIYWLAPRCLSVRSQIVSELA